MRLWGGVLAVEQQGVGGTEACVLCDGSRCVQQLVHACELQSIRGRQYVACEGIIGGAVGQQ